MWVSASHCDSVFLPATTLNGPHLGIRLFGLEHIGARAFVTLRLRLKGNLEDFFDAFLLFDCLFRVLVQ